MAKKTDTAHAPPTEEVVLRDESDAIIDNLKRQLQSLQQELAQTQRAGSGRSSTARAAGPGAAGGGSGVAGGSASAAVGSASAASGGAGAALGGADAVGSGTRAGPTRGEMMEHWNASLTPHLAARLQAPAEELTQRLTRLMEQVSDPELRAELELCRDTAFFISSTFERIRDNHQLLTESLIDEKEDLSAAEFGARLTDSLRRRGGPVPALNGLEAGAAADGERLLVSPKSVGTVLLTLAQLAGTMFGTPARVAASLVSAEGGAPASLRLTVTTPQTWPGMEKHQEVSAVIFRPGVRANSIVDLLYVEKIVELQGGSIGFNREQGQVHGFEILWPCG